MKLPSLLLLTGLLLCACKEKSAAPRDESAATTPAGTAAQPPSRTPVPKVEALPAAATRQQLGSLLRVRVAVGGLPPQDSAAALLHRDEFAEKTLVQGSDRFVLALLREFDEAQLRDPGTRIVVFRNKVGNQGETATAACPARLVQFDPASGLALLTYTDTFKYALDVGFRLERTPLGGADLPLLRTYAERETGAVLDARAFDPPPTDPRNPNRPPEREPVLATERQLSGSGRPGSVRIQPFTSDFGIYRWAAGGADAVELPKLTPPAKGDDVHLAVGAPDKLIGFVSTSADGAVAVTPVDKFAVEFKVPVLKAKSLAFDPNGWGGQVRLMIEIENAPSEKNRSLVSLHVAEVRGENPQKPSPVNPQGTFAPLEKGAPVELGRDAKTQLWVAMLRSPEAVGERVYQVQIAWPLLGGTRPPMGYGQPFLVKLERRAEGVFPSVEGLATPATPVAAGAAAGMAQAGPAKAFPLESAVMNVSLMAGGREALLELAGPPHWKRFSFAKNEWLPLPAVDLSGSSLAGNLSALFVLDRRIGEVRKYALTDLQPAGTAKLIATAEFITILAGCNSDHAPVHVLLATDAQALDAKTLQRRDMPRIVGPGDSNQRKFARTQRFRVTGDGLAFYGASGEERGAVMHCYNTDAQGLEAAYLDTSRGIAASWEGNGVSAAFTLGLWIACQATPTGQEIRWQLPDSWNSATKLLATNCPVLFALHPAESSTLPPTSAKLSLFSYFAPTAFAEVDVPEFSDLKLNDSRNYEVRAFFDPYSLRLATLSAEKKTWFVRNLTAPEKLEQPILLNWPDTSIPRGGEFLFQPQLLGGKKFSAEVYDSPGLALIAEADGTIRFPVSKTEFASIKLLSLTVPGSRGGGLSCPIPLHVSGSDLPFAAPPGANRKMFNLLGASYRTMNLPTSQLKTLPATLHTFPDPITDVLGPVAGNIVLITRTRRLDFFSLETRKITGTTPVSPGTGYFAGAGALFEYDPAKRTLTRMTVPDGRRGAALNLPDNVTLTGIGMGTEAQSPVTLALRVAPGKEPTKVGDLVIKADDLQDIVTVWDGQTLQSKGWTQPVSLARMLGQSDPPQTGNLLVGDITWPAILPASHNGSIVHLGGRFLACAPSYAVTYPFPGLVGRLDFHPSFGENATGSISGLMAISPRGAVFKGGQPVPPPKDGSSVRGTPCGRYGLVRLSKRDDADECLQVRLLENDNPLLLAGRMDCFLDDGSSTAFPSGPRFFMLGDHGPLALLDRQARKLNLVDLDIPTVMKTLAPDDFHVTSQPQPCLMAGGTLQYQVQVNNPSAVQTYRLRTPVPGAQLTLQGLLKYTAPAKITDATKTNISIEIVGQKGQIYLHEFPIYILPTPSSPSLPGRNTI